MMISIFRNLFLFILALGIIVICPPIMGGVRASQQDISSVFTITVRGDWTWGNPSAAEAQQRVREYPNVYGKVFAQAEANKLRARLLEWRVIDVEVKATGKSFRARAVVEAVLEPYEKQKKKKSSDEFNNQVLEDDLNEIVDNEADNLNSKLMSEIFATEAKIDALISVITKIGSRGAAKGLWRGGKDSLDYIDQLNGMKEKLRSTSSQLTGSLDRAETSLVGSLENIGRELERIDSRFQYGANIHSGASLFNPMNDDPDYNAFAEAVNALQESKNQIEKAASNNIEDRYRKFEEQERAEEQKTKAARKEAVVKHKARLAEYLASQRGSDKQASINGINDAMATKDAASPIDNVGQKNTVADQNTHKRQDPLVQTLIGKTGQQKNSGTAQADPLSLLSGKQQGLQQGAGATADAELSDPLYSVLKGARNNTEGPSESTADIDLGSMDPLARALFEKKLDDKAGELISNARKEIKGILKSKYPEVVFVSVVYNEILNIRVYDNPAYKKWIERQPTGTLLIFGPPEQCHEFVQNQKTVVGYRPVTGAEAKKVKSAFIDRGLIDHLSVTVYSHAEASQLLNGEFPEWNRKITDCSALWKYYGDSVALRSTNEYQELISGSLDSGLGFLSKEELRWLFD